MTKHATPEQLRAAIEILALPLADRPREFWPHAEGVMLLDESGGMPVEAFSDATCLHYFLTWLRQSRRERAAHESLRHFLRIVGGVQ